MKGAFVPLSIINWRTRNENVEGPRTFSGTVRR